MKKRSQLIILSILIFVAVFVVLSSAIFSFSEIGVDYLTTTKNLCEMVKKLLTDLKNKQMKS